MTATESAHAPTQLELSFTPKNSVGLGYAADGSLPIRRPQAPPDDHLSVERAVHPIRSGPVVTLTDNTPYLSGNTITSGASPYAPERATPLRDRLAAHGCPLAPTDAFRHVETTGR